MPTDSSRANSAEQANVLSLLPDLWVVWADSLGDSGIKIAVLDGPPDLSHPCFRGADVERVNTLVTDAAGTGGMSAHGTHVTSLIFGQPNSSVLGVAPRCHGLLLPVFRDFQEGRLSQLDLARAIEQAVQQGAHIINISGGERSPEGQADEILSRAIRLCDENNVLVVAAVGNDGCECLHVPAALPAVLAVGAMDAANQPLGVSNWGKSYRSNGVLAPGKDIPGAVPGGRTALMTGSSFATPIVAGFAALLLSIQKKTGQKVDPKAVRKAILESAHKCDPGEEVDCRRYLSGSLNISGAYDLIRKAGNKVMSLDHPSPISVQDSSTAGIPPAIPAMRSGVVAAGVEASEAATPRMAPVVQPPAASVQAPIAEASSSAGVSPSGMSPAAPSALVPVTSAPAILLPPAPPTGVVPSCACNGNNKKQNVYGLGLVGYDFGTEARRDSFKQLMAGMFGITANPYNPIQLADYLDNITGQKSWAANTPYEPNDTIIKGGYVQIVTSAGTSGPGPDEPLWSNTYGDTTDDPQGKKGKGGVTWTNAGPIDNWGGTRRNSPDSTKLIWTLNLDLSPIYAIEAEQPYADSVYQILRSALRGESLPQDHPNYIERVSVPGILTSRTVRLFSGQEVPVLIAQPRGMYTWNTVALVNAVIPGINVHRQNPLTAAEEKAARNYVTNFLQKLYYELRNLGQASSDRALNFSATNTFQAASLMVDAIDPVNAGLISPELDANGNPVPSLYTLDSISVAKSPFCRFDSDCWDVRLTFFDPMNVLHARLIYQFTVDVSDEMPVTLGPVRKWAQGGPYGTS